MGEKETNEERRLGEGGISIQMLQDIHCEQPLSEHTLKVILKDFNPNLIDTPNKTLEH
jgi:hypothetical protein